jgi:hypothetical protein
VGNGIVLCTCIPSCKGLNSRNLDCTLPSWCCESAHPAP